MTRTYISVIGENNQHDIIPFDTRKEARAFINNTLLNLRDVHKTIPNEKIHLLDRNGSDIIESY